MEKNGDSWAKVQAINVFIGPILEGKLQDFNIRVLTQGRFSIVKDRAKSKVLSSSLSPWGGVYSKALKGEKT